MNTLSLTYYFTWKQLLLLTKLKGNMFREGDDITLSASMRPVERKRHACPTPALDYLIFLLTLIFALPSSRPIWHTVCSSNWSAGAKRPTGNSQRTNKNMWVSWFLVWCFISTSLGSDSLISAPNSQTPSPSWAADINVNSGELA